MSSPSSMQPQPCPPCPPWTGPLEHGCPPCASCPPPHQGTPAPFPPRRLRALPSQPWARKGSAHTTGLAGPFGGLCSSPHPLTRPPQRLAVLGVPSSTVAWTLGHLLPSQLCSALLGRSCGGGAATPGREKPAKWTPGEVGGGEPAEPRGRARQAAASRAT